MSRLFERTAGGYFRADSVTLTGNVTIGANTSLWFQTVIRGDVAPIVIGRRVNVQDGTIIHCDTDIANLIEDDVSIGHRAIVHGQRIGRGSLIGMGAIVMGQTDIGEESLIAAGALVSPGMKVPPRSVVMGVPGKVVRPVRDKDLDYMKWLTTRYTELAERYLRGEIVSHGWNADEHR